MRKIKFFTKKSAGAAILLVAILAFTGLTNKYTSKVNNLLGNAEIVAMTTMPAQAMDKQAFLGGWIKAVANAVWDAAVWVGEAVYDAGQFLADVTENGYIIIEGIHAKTIKGDRIISRTDALMADLDEE
jgi:asparagine N-glycosylation enzyme membrane subunit Stt3